jgi:hypothetical protein
MDNPPAFPQVGNPTWGMEPSPGMTLRDWFAGQALAASGLDAAHRIGWSESEMKEQATEAARVFYIVADAMLAARTNGGQSNG